MTQPPVTTGASATAAGRETVVIKLDGPGASSAASQRRPAYISPATQSIAISFTPSGGGATQTFNQNLTAGSSGCTASLVSPLICSVTIALAPGTYVGNFATYDGPLSGGVPTGQILSQNQNFSTTIVAGQTNTIDAVLQGVPASVMVSAIGGNAIQTAPDRFTFDKCFSTQQLSVLAVDADGNVIVGPGAPAISLTPSAAPFTIDAPTTASPNTFTIRKTSLPVGLSIAGAIATITPGAGGPAAPPSTLIGITFNTSNCGVDAVIGSGFNAPAGVAADANGNVYVADTGNNKIKEIVGPDFTVTQTTSNVT
jgi:hypothetical protein